MVHCLVGKDPKREGARVRSEGLEKQANKFQAIFFRTTLAVNCAGLAKESAFR